MARASVEIAVNAQGYASSLYPAGAPVTTGSLRYIGNPVHNGEITIVSDGTIDFGTTYPFLIQSLMLDNSVAGTFLDVDATTFEVGQQIASCDYTVSSATQLKLISVPSLPYGVGVEMATHDVLGSQIWGKIETISNVPYDVVFKYEFGVYPAVNQANFVALAGAGAQVKGSWDLAGSNAANTSTDTDAYTAIFNPNNGTFQEAPFSSSNGGFIGSVIYHDSPPIYMGLVIDSTHINSNVVIRESCLKFSLTEGAVHERLVDTVNGTLCNYHKNVNLVGTITNPLPDRHHYPANIQNISGDTGMGYFLSERVILGRSAARVEISDTPIPQTDPAAVTGITRRFALTIPKAWSRGILKMKLREHIFAGETLNGKYFNIYTHGTLDSPNGVFVGSILIDGEKF